MEYVAGQRWVSESEPNLGLGVIISADNRMVEVLFHSKEITRSYAKQNAPLTRVSYDEGDEISHVNGETYLVLNVESNDGILYYTAAPLYAKEYPTDERAALNTIIAEIDLDHRLQFNSPESRLLCGQIDKNKWFDLRYHTLKLHATLAASGCKGFLGSRVSLIPHQFHIAEEVSLRHSPRVLLADEVGLGKTIEAGLILHQQLVTGIAQRALIIVPENLLHQWLVEMARRFNLMFSLFDAERCKEHGDENPFESEQLVICGLNFLVGNKQRREQITSCDWDVLVVDEAHHIEWMPEQPSEAYNLVEQLANIAPSVLLLTATPEQLGPEGHFARLRLLDPYRFHNLESFLAEEENYVPVAKCALKILSNTALDDSQAQLLTNLIGSAAAEAYQQAANSQSDQLEILSQDILSTLIDQHGTGRVLFRNTRKSIKGFTQRKLHPLPCPSAYSPLTGDINHLAESLAEQIYPERFYQENKILQDKDWWLIDARFQCLLQVLKQNPDKKIILICAHQDTVLDIEQGLRVDHGIYAAVFHEGLNIIERDRSAAYFADKDDDCQLLICSEIGSEGRNFQFAHHLFLFDMPLNADLLEQRIGRLDRIGQSEDIQIHLPYFAEQTQAMLFRWYAEGLNAFEQSSATCSNLQQAYNDKLNHFLLGIEPMDTFTAFLNEVSAKRLILEKQLEEGRDPLLELNSSGQSDLKLLEKISEEEDSFELRRWITSVFNLYGVDHDEGSDNSMIAHPSDHMHNTHFPSLPEEGTTLCFDRATALSREDIQFFTLDHPMATGVMEMILGNERGNSAITTIKLANFAPGTLLIEAIYLIETIAPAVYQADKYLPVTLIRVLIDPQGQDLSDKVSYEQLAPRLNNVKRDTARAVIKSELEGIKQSIKAARPFAEKRAELMRLNSSGQAEKSLDIEYKRMTALKKKNPSIRQSEIDFLEEKKFALLDYIENAPLNLNALRVIVSI